MNINYVGVYKIQNIVNNKMYIGCTNDFNRRWWQHQNLLNRGIHHCHPLQEDWNKYGENSFIHEIIEECDVCDLYSKEQYWIEQFKAYNDKFGYNLTFGGKGILGKTYTNEEKNILSKLRNPDEIVQIDLDGNYVKTWRSATHAQRTLGIRACSILDNARHDTYQANGYIWFYKKEYDIIDFDINEYKQNSNGIFNLPVIQFDLYGNIIKEWFGFDEIRQIYGKNISSVIRKVCNHEKKTYDKYIWLFKHDNFELTNDYLLGCRISTSSCLIEQYSKNNLVKIWDREEFNQSSEYNFDTVSRFCKSGKLYKNYTWKYRMSPPVPYEEVG